MKNKKESEEFFIGWSPNIPPKQNRFLKKVILQLFLVIVIVGTVFALSQKHFNPSTNELGEFQSVSGVVYEYPVPLLKVKVSGDDYQSFILVGVGKHGAQATLDLIKERTGPNLQGYEVSLNGQAVYYDGKTLLEVPAPQNAMDTVRLLKEDWPKQRIEDMGRVSLQGEIIDPKCYFGVMNPAYGKIHRSCAIRCISGGIPPVLRIHNDDGVAEYFFLLGPDGQAINKEVVEMVGLPVVISGDLQVVDDWFVLKIDPQKDITRNKDASIESDYVNDVK